MIQAPVVWKINKKCLQLSFTFNFPVDPQVLWSHNIGIWQPNFILLGHWDKEEFPGCCCLEKKIVADVLTTCAAAIIRVYLHHVTLCVLSGTFFLIDIFMIYVFIIFHFILLQYVQNIMSFVCILHGANENVMKILIIYELQNYTYRKESLINKITRLSFSESKYGCLCIKLKPSNLNACKEQR